MSCGPHSDDARKSFLAGVSSRSQLTDCPLGAFSVQVDKCTGLGECAQVCFVAVFETSPSGVCVVANEELCFGCMACVAQCAEGGVKVEERIVRSYPTFDELLR